MDDDAVHDELAGHVPNWTPEAEAAFTFDGARAAFEGPGLNLAFEAVIRHAQGPHRDRVALAWRGRKGDRLDLAWRDLDRLTARFARVLRDEGLEVGDRVFALCDRVPELYVAALGILRAGCVFCPLFSAFGPEPIRVRMEVGDGRALLTTPGLYRRKVRKILGELPLLERVFVVHEGGSCGAVLAGEAVPDRSDEHTIDLVGRLAAADEDFGVADTRGEDMALIHFTSGTTGKPKGAVHGHGAGVWHLASGRFALDLRPGDVFWCTADPGWVTGTSYGILAPLLAGATNLIDEAEFDPARWYRLLDEERVTVWYTAPTAIRMLMRAGAEPLGGRTLPDLRLMCSVGEPLNPECVRWGLDVLGRPFHDTWWQSETGGILIGNALGAPIKPGAMGKPLPGIEAAVLRRTNGDVEVLEDGEGELAIRVGWPSMFRGYLHEEERYQRCFVGDWYLTGDLARKDADGTFWFVGRADDVIKAAGHLIGPFEVESGLMEHPAAAEVAVIGKPDALAGNLVKAFVLLAPGFEAGDALRKELHAHARRRLGPAVAPREIAFVDDLPRTRSGKIMRRLLRARELGLPEGDTSTLETPA